MLMLKKILCVLAMMLLILATVSMCSTAQAGPAEAVDPALSFPSFPDPYDSEGNPIPRLEGNSVIVPKDFWIGIVVYVIDVERCREVYEAWCKIYLAEER